ncbi:TPA: hypothetical protein ACSCXL_002333, partial [Aeromonas veronii]
VNRSLEISFQQFHSINPVYPCRLIANITAGYPIFFLQPFGRRLSGGLERAWEAVSRKREVSTVIDGDKANKWVMEFTVRLINFGMVVVMGVVVCLYSKLLLANRALFNSDEVIIK